MKAVSSDNFDDNLAVSAESTSMGEIQHARIRPQTTIQPRFRGLDA